MLLSIQACGNAVSIVCINLSELMTRFEIVSLTSIATTAAILGYSAYA